jgi:hypothetical protein
MRFRPNYLSALLVAAALGTGCDVHVGDNGVSLDVSSGKATEEWSRTYTVNRGGTLEIANSNGPIVVEAASGAQVEVKATKQVRARSDEEAQAVLKNLEIKEDVTPGRVSLQTATNPVTNFGRRSATIAFACRPASRCRSKPRTGVSVFTTSMGHSTPRRPTAESGAPIFPAPSRLTSSTAVSSSR